MIDFEKLAESINAVNEVLNDLEVETKAIRQHVDNEKKEMFMIMFNDVLKYFQLIKKAHGNEIPSFGLTMTYDDGHQIRMAKDWHCGNYYCCLKVRNDLNDDWYSEWIYERRIDEGKCDENIFENLNRSPKSVQWLVNVVAMDWDYYKIQIENLVAKYANNIITERSKKMHEEYERVSNEAERLGI